jgi:uncharacterized protein YjbJ (UPF0337 family)
MESIMKEQTSGALHRLQGKIKEVAGMISDSPKLHPQSAGARIAGKTWPKIGQYNQFWGK